MAAQKPRTTRSKRPAKSDTVAPTEPSYLGGFADTISGLSVVQKTGLTVSALALVSTALVRLSSPSKSANGKATRNGKASYKSTPGGFDQRSPFPGGNANGSKGQKVTSAEVQKIFQTCLSSKRPQQQLIAERFLDEILGWSTQQLDTDGRTIVVNFLFWHYRGLNVPDVCFKSDQADHIRHWADYPLKPDTKWEYYNIKFDYLFSTAFLQMSIPHLRRFYQWINAEIPRDTPDEFKSRKPNYLLCRYQCACILGEWSDAVMSLGSEIKSLAAHVANPSAAPKKDYLMHYTLRALEMPSSNPNYGMIFKIADQLISEFPPLELSPPTFGSWNVLSFRYRNKRYPAVKYMEDQDFVYATERIIDDDGFYVFYPQRGASARLSKEVKIWGRICQLVSPIPGAAGFLPLTGAWNDTKLYLETSWTYSGAGQRLCRKHVVMRVERIPVQRAVQQKSLMGKMTETKGYVWKGEITVHLKKMAPGKTLKDLYEKEGEDYFDARKEKEKEETKGNGAVVDGDADGGVAKVDESAVGESESAVKDKKEEEEDKVETQVYEVELVITKDKDEPDKMMQKRLHDAFGAISAGMRR